MIQKGRKEVVTRYWGKVELVAKYIGKRLVWMVGNLLSSDGYMLCDKEGNTLMAKEK